MPSSSFTPYRLDSGVLFELLLVLIVKFLLAIFTFGLALPAGIFVPALIVSSREFHASLVLCLLSEGLGCARVQSASGGAKSSSPAVVQASYGGGRGQPEVPL